MDHTDLDKNWPQSLAEIKRIVNAEFKEKLVPQLKSMDFSHKEGAYYRAHGRMFQAVGMHVRKHRVDVEISIVPYWSNSSIDLFDRVGNKRSLIARKTTHKISSTIYVGIGHYVFNPRAQRIYVKDLYEFFELVYKDYNDIYFPLLESIKDEEDYIHLWDKGCHLLPRFWNPDEIILLYLAYRRNSCEYLSELYEKYFTSQLDWYVNFHLDNLADAKKDDFQRRIIEEYAVQVDRSYLEKDFEERLKVLAPRIQNALQSGDLSWFDEFYKTESQEMKKFFFENFKLNFED